MRQKFGDVSLFMIETFKNNENVFKGYTYTDIEEFNDFKRKHKVSDRLMDSAFDFSKLYLKGKIDIPLQYIEKLSKDEADKLIVNIKGKNMNARVENASTERDYNNQSLSVHFVNGEYSISGDKIKDSSKARGFLKQNGASYDAEAKSWKMKDIFKDMNKDDLGKESLLYGMLSSMHRSEQSFELSKTKYYEAKQSGNEELTQAREFVYDIANIVISDNFSPEKRAKYFDESLEKAVKKLDELNAEIAKGENVEEIQNQIERTEKYIAGDTDRRSHLEHLTEVANKLQDMGYLKTVGEHDTMVISSTDHRKVLTSAVAMQNEKAEIKKSFLEDYLSEKADKIAQNQDQTQAQDQEATQAERQSRSYKQR